jgi:hypothetical protein
LILQKDKQDWQILNQTNQEKEKEDPNFKNQDEKGDVTTVTNEIQRIIREYFANLYFGKIEEMDKFPET